MKIDMLKWEQEDRIFKENKKKEEQHLELEFKKMM